MAENDKEPLSTEDARSILPTQVSRDDAVCVERKEGQERALLGTAEVDRPAVFGDQASYQARFERLAGLADIVKLSEEDLAWLEPGAAFSDLAKRWPQRGHRG